MSDLFSNSNPKISKICDKIINSVPSIRKSPRLIQYKFHQKVKSLNFKDNVCETITALFKGLSKNPSDKVQVVDLIQHLISLGINIDPILFGNVNFHLAIYFYI